ncbi:MAG: diadenylate cyclase CdaA [Phycisphaerales bacterium]|nr:diadenylate cyclase CdaA [Planctomycetota bacterium]MCH8509278.1 diadenylate cyclase CdaA [Phycisphaerales bacterium]
MTTIDRLTDLLNRLGSYALWQVAIELLLIWVAVFAVIRFIQGTRAARALKGLIVLLVLGTVMVRVLGDDSFQRLGYLYDRLLAVIAVALVVIFQPELRRGLIRLGETRFFRNTAEGSEATVGAVAPACSYLSKSRFGAIMVIERTTGLKTLVEGGTELNAELSAALLQTIFYPGTALHDLAVVIKGNTVHAAGVQLPMADPGDMTDPRFGSRHRAAVGLTKESDAIVVVVSEETGEIRLAERGELSGPIPTDRFADELRERLGRVPMPVDADGHSEGFEGGEGSKQNGKD